MLNEGNDADASSYSYEDGGDDEGLGRTGVKVARIECGHESQRMGAAQR